MAFWVNAYNAFVLQTIVIELSDSRHQHRLSRIEHPADSRRVRADEASRGRAERDARRDREDDPAGVQGAAAVSRARPRRVGSGRLRSEAYTADRLKKQLADVQKEFVNEDHMLPSTGSPTRST